MEQKNDGTYALPWLKRRQDTKDEPDPEFYARLEELCRGAQQ